MNYYEPPAWTKLKSYYDKIINSWRKGFFRGIYGSVTNEIHGQIGQLKKAGIKPSAIILGRRAYFIFAKECAMNPFNPKEYPTEYLGIPIKRSDKISGVAVI